MKSRICGSALVEYGALNNELQALTMTITVGSPSSGIKFEDAQEVFNNLPLDQRVLKFRPHLLSRFKKDNSLCQNSFEARARRYWQPDWMWILTAVRSESEPETALMIVNSTSSISSDTDRWPPRCGRRESVQTVCAARGLALAPTASCEALPKREQRLVPETFMCASVVLESCLCHETFSPQISC